VYDVVELGGRSNELSRTELKLIETGLRRDQPGVTRPLWKICALTQSSKKVKGDGPSVTRHVLPTDIYY